MTRIAFVGKGGSGKTTLASLFCRIMTQQQILTLAIDADINQNLGAALGYDEAMLKALPEVGNDGRVLKEILRGTNPRIPSTAIMVKTTLPGEGSHLVRLQPSDPVMARFALRDGAQRFFMRVGGFEDSDMGVSCYHAKTGGAELLLNHVLDTQNEAVVVDMTAGADAFASGLFTRFDLTVMVVEPTLKSVGVYQQYKQYAEGYNLRLKVVGNKIETPADLAFVQDHCGADMIAHMARSGWVKAQEQGQVLPDDALEPAVQDAMLQVWRTAQSQPRDWAQYWQQGVHFHEKNALSWANQSVGTDVRDQTNHDFLATLKA